MNRVAQHYTAVQPVHFRQSVIWKQRTSDRDSEIFNPVIERHRFCPYAFRQLLSHCLSSGLRAISHPKTAKNSRTVKKSR